MVKNIAPAALLLLALSSDVTQAQNAYIANFDPNTVSVINTQTNNVFTTIPINKPFGVAVSHDGTRAYITGGISPTWGRLSVINTVNNAILASIPVGDDPEGAAVSPDDKKIYVVSSAGDTLSVVDAATHAVTTIPVNSLPVDVAISPNGKTIYVSNALSGNISVIDAATLTLTATIQFSVANFEQPIAFAFSSDGKRLYVTRQPTHLTVIDTATNKVIATAVLGTAPRGIAIEPSTGNLYIANFYDDTVSVVDTKKNKVIATVPVGSEPYGVAAITGKVYVVNSGSDNVSEIDPSKNKVVATIPVGGQPISFGNFIQPAKFAGFPGKPNCVSASLAGINNIAGATKLGFGNVSELRQSVSQYCYIH